MSKSAITVKQTFIGPEKKDFEKFGDDWLKEILNSDEFKKHVIKQLKKEVEQKVYALPSTDLTRLSEEKQRVNAEYIYDYLYGKGWTREAICGVLGNIQRESWFNPGVWENRIKFVINGTELQEGDVDKGYGLVQWTPAYDKIFIELNATAYEADEMAQNNAEQLMITQLEYLISTCEAGGNWLPSLGVSTYGSPYYMSFEDFISSTNDPGELALVFHGNYERSADGPAEKNERVKFAGEWYTYFSNR